MNRIIKRNRNGSIMINTLLIIFFLVASGTAFMMWAVDESYQADFELARSQAYYTAQHGILSEALSTMRSRNFNALPAGYERLHDGSWLLENGEQVGGYVDIGIRRVDNNQEVNVFQTINQYDLEATGIVQINDGHQRVVDVKRSVTMRTQLRTFSGYMYLTNNEMTMFNEIIWFWTPDTLYGRVHSNSMIGIHNAPQFHAPISTTASYFVDGKQQAWFAFDPQFDAPRVYFPETAENLRAGAAGGGGYVSNDDGTWQSRLTATQGGWFLEQWQVGVPYDSTRIEISRNFPFGNNLAIFIEGDVQFFGSQGGVGMVAGRTTVGTSGDLELWDNVLYSGLTTGHFPEKIEEDFPHMLGLVGEGRIIIKDVYPNGRGNGLSRPGGHNRQHIIITAALVALGEQFTFEHQNDNWNTYNWCACPGEHCGEGDERGSIYLRGAVTQVRRGYVHRSNCGGTGYAKDYYYDLRLERIPPPFYLEAIDEEGASLFDIVWWKEEAPE
ncbi:MAG: hypothetical protein P9L92_13530 [Candidatus Electryonea clarkiae]|nr:hypothetical protein [Candidatus Electryonea clarkiae]MDP8286124.1 hypothetical protein [Candidatus Electryonea clarkiae]